MASVEAVGVGFEERYFAGIAARPIYFASGASHVNDMRGFARILHPFGVSLAELSHDVAAELASLGHLPLPIFIDTGAFSEVNVDAGVVTVVDPIDDTEWERRMGMMERLVLGLRSNAYVVAPDRVGDQAETLVRLRRWAPALRRMRDLGAHVIVPIQRRPWSLAKFDALACEALGFDDFVRGIPGNKDAVPINDLESYLRAVRPRAVHILGMGPKNARYQAVTDVVRRLCPGAALTCDSNAISATTGHSNGRDGGARILTRYQSGKSEWGPLERDSAIAMAFGPALYFARAMEAYAAAGLTVRRAEPALQLGLYDGA